MRKKSAACCAGSSSRWSVADDNPSVVSVTRPALPDMQGVEYSLLPAQTHRRLERAMTPFRISVLTLLTLSSGVGVLRAQSGPAVATVAKIEGIVYLNDQPVAQGAAPIALGEVGRIRTDAGRAVVSLKRSGALVVGDHTSVSVLANGVYNFNKI